jgi:hypothetical protein
LVDNFLAEVDERVRSDRYESMFRRGLPWLIGAILLLVLVLGGIWGWQSWQKSRTDKASESYAAALESLAGGDSAGAYAKFAVVAKDGPSAYKAEALMHQAGIRLGEGKTQEAVALLDEAAKASSDPMIADNARLKSALALIDTAPYAGIEGRLKPLLDEKRPYRIAAREALAMAKIKAGQYAAARSDFSLLTVAQDVPDSMRQRAQAAVSLIDGGAASSIVQTLTAKPVMPTLPGAPGAGQSGQVQPGAPAAQPGAPR